MEKQTTESIYDRARREFQQAKRDELELGLSVIAGCEKLGIAPPNLLGKTGVPLNSGQALIARIPWAEAIDLVLRDAQKSLTVDQITRILQERGRVFPPGTRPAVSVSSVISTKHAEMGWLSVGKRPRRWKKKPEDQ